MERRSIAIHEDHGGGEVEHAGRQDPQAGAGEERIARQQTSLVEVVTAARQHHHSKQRHRRHPRQADYCHATLQPERTFIHYQNVISMPLLNK